MSRNTHDSAHWSQLARVRLSVGQRNTSRNACSCSFSFINPVKTGLRGWKIVILVIVVELALPPWQRQLSWQRQERHHRRAACFLTSCRGEGALTSVLGVLRMDGR